MSRRGVNGVIAGLFSFALDRKYAHERSEGTIGLQVV
jgi:hypothetical protein